MLDPITITTGIAVVLGKYALDKGAELGKEVGPKALETAKEMFVAALEKLRRTPDGTFVAGKYEEKPEAYEGAMEDELGKVVAEDAAFKSQMETLLKQYDTQAADHAAITGTTYHAVLTGDGAIAQGDGATAVGAGGVIIDGDVSGTIVTGNRNTITT